MSSGNGQLREVARYSLEYALRNQLDAGSPLPDVSRTAGALRGWLGEGPIQDPTGAYCAWIDAGTDERAFAYPEITGYALTFLAGRRDASDAEMDRGRKAAEWLLERADQRDFPPRPDWDDQSTYSFDLAMVSTGLIAFGRRTSNEPCRESGIELASKLRDMALSPGGLQPVAIDRGVSRKAWSTDGRTHLLKATQCLLLADREGLPDARRAAARLVHDSATLQQANGAFRTGPEERVTMIHPHLYGVEGLWVWASAVGDTSAWKRAVLGVQWAFRQQLPNGGIPRSASGGAEQSDTTAQAVRMAVALGIEPPGLDAAIDRLLQVASVTHGGAALPYQPDCDARHHNAWATMFGVQALEWAVEGPGEWWRLV